MFHRYDSSKVGKPPSIIYLDLFYCLPQPFAGHLNATVRYDLTLVSLERAQTSRDFLDLPHELRSHSLVRQIKMLFREQLFRIFST